MIPEGSIYTDENTDTHRLCGCSLNPGRAGGQAHTRGSDRNRSPAPVPPGAVPQDRDPEAEASLHPRCWVALGPRTQGLPTAVAALPFWVMSLWQP